MIEITEQAAEKLRAYLSDNKIDSPVRIAAIYEPCPKRMDKQAQTYG